MLIKLSESEYIDKDQIVSISILKNDGVNKDRVRINHKSGFITLLYKDSYEEALEFVNNIINETECLK